MSLLFLFELIIELFVVILDSSLKIADSIVQVFLFLLYLIIFFIQAIDQLFIEILSFLCLFDEDFIGPLKLVILLR